MQEINKPLKPGLYVVPTPIGNLEDITLRAINVLKLVDIIYCEDTRVSNKLLSHYGIKKNLKVYNDHSSEKDRLAIVQKAKECAVALISDAGMPLISDPGFKLIQHIKQENVFHTVLPGACAAVTGLVLSGYCSENFAFFGFFNPKKIESYKDINTPLIFYETPHDLLKTLESLLEFMPNRDISVCRELTKLFEESVSGTILDVLNDFKDRDFIKGEFVLVLSSPKNQDITDNLILSELEKAFSHSTGKNAVSFVADQLNISKKRVYALYTKHKLIE